MKNGFLQKKPRFGEYGMYFPTKIPYLKWLTVAWGVYGVLWISLEGVLWRVVLMGVWVLVLGLGYGGQRWLGGRLFGWWGWVFLGAGVGGSAGIFLPILIFAFMAIKTGLHAHGVEFLAEDIVWVFEQMWVWGIAGILTGLGMALLTWKPA
jgi:hypothetical protein